MTEEHRLGGSRDSSTEREESDSIEKRHEGQDVIEPVNSRRKLWSEHFLSDVDTESEALAEPLRDEPVEVNVATGSSLSDWPPLSEVTPSNEVGTHRELELGARPKEGGADRGTAKEHSGPEKQNGQKGGNRPRLLRERTPDSEAGPMGRQREGVRETGTMESRISEERVDERRPSQATAAKPPTYANAVRENRGVTRPLRRVGGLIVNADFEEDEEEHLGTVLIKQTLLEGPFDFSINDIIAVIRLTGSRETDVCLASEKAYRMFWAFCKTAQRIDRSLLEKFEMIPLFRGDVKVLTVAFRTSTIPAQDVAYWVSKYAKVLKGPDKKYNEEGFWNGEYCCVVSFKNTNAEGNREGKIPKYFFLGGDRGTTRYSGQPQACFQCGSHTHHRRTCTTALCSRCGERGHLTAACHKSICCNLCGEQGHTYFWCPKAFYNRQDAKRFEQVSRKAEMGKQRAEVRPPSGDLRRQ
uniref:CCHC-type domain-containing protein n=1 Tax=Varanus komodoensis TaxID=61221 RepID=A0A8D2L378_VARKO